MTTCSDTRIELQQATSGPVTPRSIAAWRSTWSDPMPAVIASFSLFALAIAHTAGWSDLRKFSNTLAAFCYPKRTNLLGHPLMNRIASVMA